MDFTLVLSICLNSDLATLQAQVDWAGEGSEAQGGNVSSQLIGGSPALLPAIRLVWTKPRGLRWRFPFCGAPKRFIDFRTEDIVSCYVSQAAAPQRWNTLWSTLVVMKGRPLGRG